MDSEVQRPVIILGAARSGTKMLRNAIASHPKLVSVPHDINFVWKFGNYAIPHDELTPSDLSPRKIEFLHRFIAKISKGQQSCRVVEKTVSNTIRVPFVREVFPRCQFIHLIRDGRDVAFSALRQWKAGVEMGRLIDKIKYFPLAALPRYGFHYAWSCLTRRFSREKSVSSWGVRLQDLDELLQRYSLLEVCGLQWTRCVEHTFRALESVPTEDHLEVRYERFVAAPHEEIERILKFLGLEMTNDVAHHVGQQVQSDQIGKWCREASPQSLSKLMPLITPTLSRLGYQDESEPKTHPHLSST